MNVSLSHWTKNLGKLASVWFLDLLFPVGLFLQNLQELNYLGAILLMWYLAETGKWQKILHKGHIPRLMCTHRLNDGKKPCFQQLPITFLKLQCRCGASPQAVELLSKVMCMHVQPHSEAKHPQVYTTVLRMICKLWFVSGEHKKCLISKEKLDTLFNEVSAQRPHRAHMCQEQTWSYGTIPDQDVRERRSSGIWLKGRTGTIRRNPTKEASTTIPHLEW